MTLALKGLFVYKIYVDADVKAALDMKKRGTENRSYNSIIRDLLVNDGFEFE